MTLNPTYKHLEDKLRLGPFSLGQWAQLLTAALAALVFAVYLSPLAPQATISVAILVAGIPFAVSYAAMGAEFSVGEMAGAALRFYRSPRRYRPGPGTPQAGYRVEPNERAAGVSEPAASEPGEPLEGGEQPLWDL